MTQETQNQSQFIVKFDYTADQISQIVEETKKIDITDIEAVKENHKLLQKIRTTIEKQEKDLVADANAFKNKVFDKRKEYLAISVPREEELKKILDDEKKRLIIEARKELLPMKLQQLSMLKVAPVDEQFILSLDDEQWVAFYNEKMAEHNHNVEQERLAEENRIKQEEEKKRQEEEKERIRIEAEQKAEQEKKDLLAKAEKEKAEAVENAKREAEEKARLEEEERKEKERKEKEAKEAEAKALALKQEQEAKDEELRKAKIEADRKYQEFLTTNNFNEATDIIVENSHGMNLYRLVGTFKPEDSKVDGVSITYKPEGK
jgi:hypothetical protein